MLWLVDIVLHKRMAFPLVLPGTHQQDSLSQMDSRNLDLICSVSSLQTEKKL